MHSVFMRRADSPALEPILGDAFGMALDAYLRGEDKGEHAVERHDGLLEWMTAEPYFGGPTAWLDVESTVADRCVGAVLDIGAGAGRFALELQERGHRVVALDISHGAVEVCRRRGVSETFEGTIFDLGEEQRSDTFRAMGNTLGLLGSAAAAPGFLLRLAAMANPGARLLGTGRDAMATADPAHLRYHEFNRSRGSTSAPSISMRSS